MKNYMEEAFAPATAYYAAQVMADTWGYPKPQVKYPLKFVIVCVDGFTLTLREKAKDWSDLGNPFFYEDKEAWLGQLELAEKVTEGNVYEWEGYYFKYKNGGFRFTGRLRKLDIDSLLKWW